MNLPQMLAQSDAVSQTVALLLLLMSVGSWIVIIWKAWLLRRVRADVMRSTAAFWQSASLDSALPRLQAFDRDGLVLPLIEATRATALGTLAVAASRSQQLTRVLRDALYKGLRKLQFGQVLLATVGLYGTFRGFVGHSLGYLQRPDWHDHRRPDHD
jgi:biopolymer transport protein ExbB